MGFMDKLRGELVDIVEWIDDSRSTLVWRFPRYHNQIKHGAQLIVRPGQTAVLVHRGELADTFGPGSHELTLDNLPILSTILGWKHGFDSPFKAEVYFVATRQITELKWGTPNPVIIRDPDFGPVRVRGFGTFTLKAVNPKALLEELVGTDSEFDAEEIQVLLRGIVSSTFADMVANSGVSLFDLASSYGELSETMRRQCAEKVDDEFGLEFPQMHIVNISVPEEVEQALDARSSMGMLGNLDAYQQYQMGRSIPVAAENPAGGLAAAGVGLGMGMAYVGGFGGPGGAGPTGAGPTGVVPPPPPANPSAVWHAAENGQSFGPFSAEQLRQAVSEGRLSPETHMWRAGMASWQPAGEVAELKDLFGAAPPPPPAE